MKIMNWVANQLGYTAKASPRRQGLMRRTYNAADTSDRFADWVTGALGPNEDLRTSLRRLRARSRDLAMNNDYMKKYLRMVFTNVIGPTGIKMQMKIENSPGVLDLKANRQVEQAWEEWGRVPTCSVTRDLSFIDIQRLAVQSVARDGEVLIRKVRGFDNPYRFALQLIEADHLDETHHTDLANGNRIRMGVETDEWGAPVAYHLRESHPGDTSATLRRQQVNRVPADEIIHLYIKERIGQVRGVPWAASTMIRLKMIGGYEEAELTGARAAASKMGFFEHEEGAAGYTGDDTDAEGNLIEEFEPGVMRDLPVGVKFKPFDPGNPSRNFKDFMKAMLRGAASGLNVAYNTLANDLEGVNFSSIRSGVLEERENWRALHWWVMQHFHWNVFPEWLTFALVTAQVNLPMAKFEKFNRPLWQPRGWAWVDPKKDIETNKIALDNKLTSWSAIVAEQGKDMEDVWRQRIADEKMAAQMGIDLTPPAPTPPRPITEDDLEDDDNENSGNSGNQN